MGSGSSWQAFEALVVEMARELPAQALAQTLNDLQERLMDDAVSGGCRCGGSGRRSAARGAGPGRTLRARASGTGRGCRGCGKVFAPLLGMLGLEGKRKTDRLTVDLAELGSQMSFAPYRQAEPGAGRHRRFAWRGAHGRG